jgi:hypothetical protein
MNLISIQIGNWRSTVFDENMFVAFTKYNNAGLSNSHLLIAAVKGFVALLVAFDEGC